MFKPNFRPFLNHRQAGLSRRQFARTLAVSAAGVLAAPAILRGQILTAN